jgi:hypothetical protein
MNNERPRWVFGDVNPEQYEADKAKLIRAEELRIGSTYTFRFKFPPIAGMQYISDFPVQVADIRMGEGGAHIELVHLETRDEQWQVGPKSVPMTDSGLIVVVNSGPGRLEGWEEGPVDVGYILEPGA